MREHGFRYPLALLAVLCVCGLLSLAPAAAQAPRVQVGICTPLKGIDAARAAGFDYVELSTTEVAGLSEADFESAAARVRQVGLPAPAANLFLPATLKVTGPDINRDEQDRYVRNAFARLSRLGTGILVFGSGGARRVPDGFAKDEAFKQLVEFGRRIAWLMPPPRRRLPPSGTIRLRSSIRERRAGTRRICTSTTSCSAPRRSISARSRRRTARAAAAAISRSGCRST